MRDLETRDVHGAARHAEYHDWPDTQDQPTADELDERPPRRHVPNVTIDDYLARLEPR